VISTGDCVYICAITAFVLVIFRIAANSELRSKSLGLGLDLEIKSLHSEDSTPCYLQYSKA